MGTSPEQILRTATDMGLAIRARRRALGLRQHELAAKVGVSRQWIVEIERGKPRAELGLLLHTIATLGLQLRMQAIPPQVANDVPPTTIDLNDVIEAARERPRR